MKGLRKKLGKFLVGIIIVKDFQVVKIYNRCFQKQPTVLILSQTLLNNHLKPPTSPSFNNQDKNKPKL